MNTSMVLPSHLHGRSSSTSSSHSASSAAHIYDLGFPSFAPSNLTTRHPSFGTHITSPADSPPDMMMLPPGSPFKPATTRLAPSYRRSRADSSPYTTHDPYATQQRPFSSRSSSCSEPGSEQEDQLSMYFHQQQHPSLGPLAGHGAQPDYGSLFTQPNYGGAIHPQQLGGMTGFGMDTGYAPQPSVPTEVHLEQLAANVRSSTTTTASDRAKQVFVQAWLSANYAPYPDGNVPRQGLYNSYRRVCDLYNIPHINTATLGKAIRLCFPAIKTRRLGVRGNSKYHYCGIRPATVAEAEFLQDFVRRTTNHQAIAASSRRGAAAVAALGGSQGGSGEDEDEDEDSEASSSAERETSIGFPPPQTQSVPHPLTLGGGLKSPTLFALQGMATDDKTPTTNTLLSAAQAQAVRNGNGTFAHAQIRGGRRGLGSTDATLPSTSTNLVPTPPKQPASGGVRSLPNFPRIDEALGDKTDSPHHLAAVEVWRWFEEHLDAVLESVRGWRFDQFEIHVRTFWGSLNGDYREVVHAPAVAGLVVRADAVVYDEILELLRSQMLSPIPPHALASLRQLAEKMEKILLLALDGYGNTFVEPKVELGARFGHLVLRFLDMFQVTQALTSVLSNGQQLSDMRRSWSEIDFESVRNQSALVCNCRHEDLVQLLEVDFVSVLDNLVAGATMGVPAVLEPVREIMNWADACCERLMAPGQPGEERTTMSSRSVLIRWGYVTSQVMRDLTIRSDPAFGAFQILKLFLDDWIALNVLRSVALSTNSVQASVEPVQYLAMSPMAGQEFPSNNSTTSMLAALHDTNYGDYTGGFDMSFLTNGGESPAGSGVAELTAGVAAAGVGSETGSETGEAGPRDESKE